MGMLDMLRGAMTGALGKRGPNDGSGKAKAQQEFDAATSHRQSVYAATNDAKQRKAADDRLHQAYEALGQFQ